MYRHTLACVAALSALWISGCLGAPAPDTQSDRKPPPAPPPDVVLIVIDTLRADKVTASRNGQPLMPHVRAFAESSTWYTLAIAQGSWTRPSMVSLFTSLYGGVHNVMFGVNQTFLEGQDMQLDLVPNDLTMIAEVMKAAGYNTAAIQSNANLSTHFNMAQGFDRYFYKVYPDMRAAEVTDRAMEAWDTTAGPRFLYVHYMDPHRPYDPPQAYRESMGVSDPPDDELELLESFGSYYDEKIRFDLGAIKAMQAPALSQRAHEYVRELYDAEVRYADDEVAELIDHVRSADPNAIIILTSDHGEELWEHGSIGHGKTLYQELIHVPLIISVPGTPADVLDTGVELVDVLPTLASILELPADERWQGRVLPPANESTPGSRPLYSITKTSLRDLDKHWDAVIDGHLKLIVNRKTGAGELYDLSADPLEQTNIATDNPEAVARLRALLDAHGEANQAHPEHQATATHDVMDEELIQQLRDQGYVR